MTEVILLICGLVAGFIAAWLTASARLRDSQAQVAELKWSLEASVQAKETLAVALQQQLRDESEKKAAALADLRNAQVQIEEQRRVFQETEKKLIDTFDALAHKALATNNQSFLELAANKLQAFQATAKGDLDMRHQAIGGLIQPLQDMLARYEQQLAAMEQQRQEAYGGLKQQLSSLQKITGSLDSALRTPQVRGSWGELALRRVVEMAGMSVHCDFTEQETLEGDFGRLRPDMIVNLPGNRRIAIDSKVPLDSFRDALEATNEPDRLAHLARHAQKVRDHMNRLGAKSYGETLDANTDFVVLFMPGEMLFAAALEQDRSLIEFGWQRKILLATPTSLIGLLRCLAYGWQQEKMAENAQQVSELGKELYARILTFAGHMDDLRKSLGKAVDSFNKGAGSLESRVLVQARRLKELGASAGDDIQPLEQIEQMPRLLNFGELSEEARPAAKRLTLKSIDDRAAASGESD